MKIIKNIADYIEDELDGAHKYIKCALLHKDDYPQLSKVFYDISVQEMHHVEMLHNEVVKLIEHQKKETGEPPVAMMAVWEYLHERHIEQSAAIKVLQSEYQGA